MTQWLSFTFGAINTEILIKYFSAINREIFWLNSIKPAQNTQMTWHSQKRGLKHAAAVALNIVVNADKSISSVRVINEWQAWSCAHCAHGQLKCSIQLWLSVVTCCNSVTGLVNLDHSADRYVASSSVALASVHQNGHHVTILKCLDVLLVLINLTVLLPVHYC